MATPLKLPSFTAAYSGTYTMRFRNRSVVSAQYIIDYSKTKPGASGFSDDTPYFIITAVAVAAAVIFAFIAFRRQKNPRPPPSSPQQPS
jgi:hypothetical protein